MKTGCFITLEGPDGSGKSSTMSLVGQFLKEKGYCLGMPVKKYKGENKDVVHPLNTEFRNKLTNAVIEKLKEGDKNEK